MQNLIKFLLVAVLIGIAVGVWLGWFDLNVGLNSKKVKDDLKGTGVEGLVPDDGKAGAAKDEDKDKDKGAGAGKDDRVPATGKDNPKPPVKGDGPKKDPAGKDPAHVVSTVREERADGIVFNIAKNMPRFSIQLIDSSKKGLDNRVMTFDLAPQSEVRVNDILSDFRFLRVGTKVVVTYYLEADPTNMSPSRNMARLIVIERPK